MASTDTAKRAASCAALDLVQDGMRLGLGTGSTAVIMVNELARRVADKGLTLRCAATSESTARLAHSLGLKVESLDKIGWLDLTIDGADEMDPDLNLIKGGGGAHLREKIVASASDRMVVIADSSKRVQQLGAFGLPVEVLAFGLPTTMVLIERALGKLGLGGCPDAPRTREGAVQRTDEGNLILDLAVQSISNPDALAAALTAIPGVVEHGLFLGLCDLAFVGDDSGAVTEFHRRDAARGMQ